MASPKRKSARVIPSLSRSDPIPYAKFSQPIPVQSYAKFSYGFFGNERSTPNIKFLKNTYSNKISDHGYRTTPSCAAT